MSNDCKPVLNNIGLEAVASFMNFNENCSINDKDSELQLPPRFSACRESLYTWKK